MVVDEATFVQMGAHLKWVSDALFEGVGQVLSLTSQELPEAAEQNCRELIDALDVMSKQLLRMEHILRVVWEENYPQAATVQ